MNKFLFTFFILFIATAHCQVIGTSSQSSSFKLSDSAEISIITCGPGNEVYTAFGHSAIRINDRLTGIDRVYNYGTFDFDTPNFYGKFAQGNLLYLLSSYDFGRFLRSYKMENRWVKAQVLDLKTADIQKTYDYLENNALPENRAYLYDYFFDNCSTRIYDVVKDVIGNKLIIPTLFNESNTSHRELIQPYLTHQSWGDFGIDIALGSIIDKDISTEQYLFLPDNVLTFFNSLKIKENGKQRKIVKHTEDILLESEKNYITTFLSPFILFSILGIIIIAVTRRNIQTNKRTKWLDFTLFFGIGIIGVVLSSISFGTDHKAAANNFNLLWAFAPNIIVSFLFLKTKIPHWIKNYIILLLVLVFIIIILWVFKVQIFSNAIIPILIFLSVRYYYLLKHLKTN